MAKAKDTLTGDLFAWEPPNVVIGYDTNTTRGGDLNSKIARVIGQALRDLRERGISRAQVAEQLTATLGRNVSEEIINKWCSEASVEHRMPLDAYIAMIDQFGIVELTGFIPSMFGYAVVDQKYTDVIRLTLLRERRAELDAQERILEASVRRGK